MARRPDLSADSAVVVINPDDEVTPELFVAWLDRRRGEEDEDSPAAPRLCAGDALDAGARS